MKRIRVAQPSLGGNERKYVLDCLDSTWISSIGPYVPAFETEFARFCGVRHAVAVSSGTSALHLALAALGVSAGDEVIVPTVTYVATANAVRYCGATPVLADVTAPALTLDPADAERRITPRTRGIVPVHLFGHPADMTAINEIAGRHRLFVLEDAAEAHGAEWRGHKAGGLGTCGAFSFFGNKIVTTGEGGMVTTDDDALAARIRLLRGQGMDPGQRYWCSVMGYNYRMTNIQAAIGLAQMESIDSALAARIRIVGWYDRHLRPLRDVLVLPTANRHVRHAFWMYAVWLRDGDGVARDAVMRRLDDAGIETRPAFPPLHTLPPYRDPRCYPVADTWAPRGICLPTHQGLTEADVRRIAEALSTALSTFAQSRRLRRGMASADAAGRIRRPDEQRARPRTGRHARQQTRARAR